MRDWLGLRKDVWFDFVPDPTDQTDNAIMERVSNTILFLSEACFNHCVKTPIAKTNIDRKCVKKCT